MSDEQPDDDISWHRFVTVLVLVFVLTVVGGSFLSDYSEVDGDLTLNTTDGTNVTFENLNSNKANLSQPFPDSETISWQSDKGNVTISATARKNLTIDEIEGAWTNVTALDGSATTVRINPDDKQAIQINHSAQVSFRDVTFGDGTADLEVTGDSTANITLEGLPAQDAVIARDSQGNYIDGESINSANATLEIPGVNEDVYLDGHVDSSPGLSNPDPEGLVDGTPSTVSIDLSDADFPDDEVTVEFFEDGNSIGSNRLTSEGTTSVSINPDLGKTQMKAVATDDYGNQQTLSWTFSTPRNMTIRDAVNPNKILDNRTSNATFFEGDDIVEKQTTNGNISMEGIPGKENVIVSIDVESNPNETPADYHSAENIIIDFSRQSDVYLVPTSETTQTVRFTLDDRTGGKFSDANEPHVLVQQPINRSAFSQPKWETVYSDQFGPQGATARLIDGQRYRITVRNNNGDTRVLGSYSADASETVELTVGELQAKPEGSGDEVAWSAQFNETGGNTAVQFEYSDLNNDTETIWIEIYEFQNESNQLTTNQSFGGPYGNFTFSEVVPASKENLSWTVDVTVSRGDEQITIKEPVGPQDPIVPGLPTRWKTIISIGSILIVGGLFSQFNGAYGALTMAALGAIFWLIGFLPPGTGIGVVVLAMIISGGIYLREREVSGI